MSRYKKKGEKSERKNEVEMNVHARTLNLFMHVYVCRCDSCQCISIIISAMIQSRIVLSIYVFCLSWQRREILSKSW